MAAIQGGFLANLGRIYALYTGTFIGFTIFIGLLEFMGVPNRILGYLFIFLTLGVYALIGWLARTAEVNEYYVAGRSVPAFYNGMATGADWMSAASFIGMAGSLYFGGYGGLAFVLGWTGGYVLVSILMAPYLRKFGQFTVPDFFSARYGGNVARALAVVVLITASFTYVVAQIVGVGIITARFLDIPFQLACFVGLLGILLCSMLGGMKAVTWTQVAQYIILIIAYLIPVVVLSAKVTGIPIPQIMYGQALEKIEALEKTFGVAQPYASAFTDAKGAYSPTAMWNFFALIIFLLYFTAPAYAAFAKLEVYQHVIGQPIASLPAWVSSWGSIGLVGACDGANAAQTFALCKGVTGNGDGILQLSEFRLHTDAVVLATPEIAGLPYVISGLVAAGGLAAALSTADGLLLAIANALSHDIYYKMIDPNADTKRRLVISRVLLGLVALVAAYVAGTLGADILFLVSWAFSMAAAGLFAGLVLGIWWKRAGDAAGIWGIIVGFGLCMFFLIATEFYGPWVKQSLSWMGDINIVKIRGRDVAYIWGINNISVGIFGIPAAFIAMLIAGWVSKPASAEMQDFIDSIRVPAGSVRNAEAAH